MSETHFRYGGQVENPFFCQSGTQEPEGGAFTMLRQQLASTRFFSLL